ncbi:GNAT family N-acetyltransferase [Nonomuraea gerenzanensis]|nr:GNAT family N-acetyltransferase [Nonomuraea gerenzanensis]UBU12380.1 GNAT family N-acetyltransferase [Nonomuraea gerenzanensis]
MDDVVLLRDVTEADLEVLLEYEHDPEAVRRSRFPPREREAFMHHWKTRVLGDPTGLVQAVTVGGELAGNLVAWWEGDRRFIGYWLGRAYWGRGVGTRALGLFLEKEQVRPLYADPFHENLASVRLLERHGFERTGTVWHDEDEHILLVLHPSREPGEAGGRRTDETAASRRAAHAYVESAERRDWESFAALLAEDVVYEMPQTRERIRGKAAFVQFNMDYPGDWHLEVRRIVADGRRAAAWLAARVGDERQDACVWFEFSGAGLISRVTDFWPEPYEPPAGREHLVERW